VFLISFFFFCMCMCVYACQTDAADDAATVVLAAVVVTATVVAGASVAGALVEVVNDGDTESKPPAK
jgi:hypothetical protein